MLIKDPVRRDDQAGGPCRHCVADSAFGCNAVTRPFLGTDPVRDVEGKMVFGGGKVLPARFKNIAGPKRKHNVIGLTVGLNDLCNLSIGRKLRLGRSGVLDRSTADVMQEEQRSQRGGEHHPLGAGSKSDS